MISRHRPRKNVSRTAQFQDIAWKILSKDRSYQRNDFSVDTAKAITRALERAFQEGFVACQKADQEAEPSVAIQEVGNGALDWMLLPSRPRNAFWTCCLFIIGESGQVEGEGYLRPVTTVRGTPGWRLIVKDAQNLTDEFGDRSIQPLLRLGLLQPLRATLNLLEISSLGYETWMVFRARGGRYPEDPLKPPSDGR